LPPSPRRPLSLNQPDARVLPPPPAGRLYAIVDVEVCARAGRQPADVARAFLAGGARLLQLRCKSWDSGPLLDLARAMVEDANAAGATLIVNDRADIARLSGAHGLHVGQEDLSPADARTVIGAGPILGMSTHTPAQWQAAVAEPISYLAIGPVFGSATKSTGYTAVGLGVVSLAAAAGREHGLPAVAIGGITLDNARSVIDAGAASLAVVSDLLTSEPESRVRAFLRALD
jgi:thiamine-phosphate pyrophosphorylase